MLSPLDSRYATVIEPLTKFYSEENYYWELLKLELLYFDFFVTRFRGAQPKNHARIYNYLRTSHKRKSEILAEIKTGEKITNHDIKAVEYHAKAVLTSLGITKNLEFLHFGLTSQDVVSVVNNSVLIRVFADVIQPKYEAVLKALENRALVEVPLIGRTHGQKANITSTRKEFQSFVFRLKAVGNFMGSKHYVKFGGALGDFVTLRTMMPQRFMNRFTEDFLEFYQEFNQIPGAGLVAADFATQTDYHKLIVDVSHKLHEAACILQDVCKDIWLYCSLGHMKIISGKHEVGSSTMPQKSNPINFENAEGNLQNANAWFELFMSKFPQSRLQRDLSDSTVLRNVGMSLGYFYLAMTEIIKGLGKLEVDTIFCLTEVDRNYQVMGEYLQLTLKMNGDDGAYEMVKQRLRGVSEFSREDYQLMVKSLDVKPSVKQSLLKVNPAKLMKP